MPCQQCDNGKWKWGGTGECQYDSKEECESANHEGLSPMDSSRLLQIESLMRRFNGEIERRAEAAIAYAKSAKETMPSPRMPIPS